MVHDNKHISKLVPSPTSSLSKPLFIWAIVIMCLASMVPTCDGCYLRNCPLGKREGKRSGADEESPVVNMCPVCGLNGVGQCIGPFTCCTPEQGCIMGVGIPETVGCAKETSNPIPCTAEGKKCGYNGEGICASRGVCCSEDRCEFTMECGSSHPNRIDLRQLIKGY